MKTIEPECCCELKQMCPYSGCSAVTELRLKQQPITYKTKTVPMGDLGSSLGKRIVVICQFCQCNCVITG
jgi:hypothetical protein